MIQELFSYFISFRLLPLTSSIRHAVISNGWIHFPHSHDFDFLKIDDEPGIVDDKWRLWFIKNEMNFFLDQFRLDFDFKFKQFILHIIRHQSSEYSLYSVYTRVFLLLKENWIICFLFFGQKWTKQCSHLGVSSIQYVLLLLLLCVGLCYFFPIIILAIYNT